MSEITIEEQLEVLEKQEKIDTLKYYQEFLEDKEEWTDEAIVDEWDKRQQFLRKLMDKIEDQLNSQLDKIMNMTEGKIIDVSSITINKPEIEEESDDPIEFVFEVDEDEVIKNE